MRIDESASKILNRYYKMRMLIRGRERGRVLTITMIKLSKTNNHLANQILNRMMNYSNNSGNYSIY